MENLYKLDGKVPILKAIPFGLQHIFAMFVANLSPITLIGLASSLKQTEIAFLLQNAMFIAGIATLIQLYPIWKIGSRLPIVMSVSFNFVAILTYVGATYGYASAMGAVLIGGLIEGCLGLIARYWKKLLHQSLLHLLLRPLVFHFFLLEHVLLVEVTVKVLALLKIYF